jgi:hypothetical protein
MLKETINHKQLHTVNTPCTLETNFLTGPATNAKIVTLPLRERERESQLNDKNPHARQHVELISGAVSTHGQEKSPSPFKNRRTPNEGDTF